MSKHKKGFSGISEKLPASVSASIGELSSVDNAAGTAIFSARASLFAIPFMWCCDAACRMVNMIIHLGADDANFAEAYRVSTAGLPHSILYPFYAWCGYIAFDFLISALKSLIDSRR